MTVEWRLFIGASAFFAVTATAYWLVASEPAGTAMLAASVPAFAMVALWLAFQARRVPPRPEDDPAAPMAAGDVGYFPSSSAWPVVASAGAVILANGMVFGPPVAVVGVLVLAAGVFGYAREADTKG